ncbi:hypothetical protein [uncultured Aeromicrobium sp.]|uniref:hypothetical protein n=1 Tax=uncultured Aeromicrobium sp. TaxID=337820 RepID=UPI0025D0FFEF|nr:hypothetical protein [uncultured Aeromicrobium sp.]
MAFQPLYMKNVDLVLGDEATGTNFKCQLRSVTLTPDTSVTKIKTLCPTGQYADTDEPEWDLELGYLYGRDTEDARKALARFLLENAGQKMPFEFLPWSGDQTEGYTGTVTIVPGPIGGEQGSFSEQSVTLPLDGQPKPIGEAPAPGAASEPDPVDEGV